MSETRKMKIASIYNYKYKLQLHVHRFEETGRFKNLGTMLSELPRENHRNGGKQ